MEPEKSHSDEVIQKKIRGTYLKSSSAGCGEDILGWISGIIEGMLS
jgi:hypothetical protein